MFAQRESVPLAAVILATCGLGCLLLACPARPESPLPVTALCQALARPICDAFYDCCDATGRAANGEGVDFTDRDSCVGFWTDACEADLAAAQMQDALKTGTTFYDLNRALFCRDALEAMAAGCSSSVEVVVFEACTDLFVGTLPVDAACREDASECASGPCVDGTCREWLSEGAVCDFQVWYCNAELFYCSFPETGGSGFCERIVNEGVLCTTSAECQSRYCDQGLGECILPPDVCSI